MHAITLRLGLLILTIVLSACASAPKSLQGTFSDALPSQQTAAQNQHVRWGGDIIRADTRAQETCFEVLARELDERARPRRRDESVGRFLACRNGFYDPAIFAPGREITVSGKVSGSELRKVGDYDYAYPRVAADVIFLWQKPLDYVRLHDPWFLFGWDPFWYRPFAPPVIIVHSRHDQRRAAER